MIKQQQGLTLLETLIALSIFALIGLASYRVLIVVTETQQAGDRASAQLAAFQKAIGLIDRDISQYLDRSVRSEEPDEGASLLLNGNRYPLELTRGGWSNPLLLARSSLQRVAYDLGPHPKANDPDSPFYDDKRQYLRRHYWLQLDRPEEQAAQVQAVLPEIDRLQVFAITNRGRLQQWPLARSGGDNSELPELLAIEFSFEHPQLGLFSRMYRVN